MDFADELSSAAFDFLFNIVKATAVNVTTALEHTMSVFRHKESSEMRCHENCGAKAQNALQWKGEQSAIALCRKFTNVAFIFVANWNGNSASEAQRGEQEQDADDSN